jgi:heat shock protein HtpX
VRTALACVSATGWQIRGGWVSSFLDNGALKAHKRQNLLQTGLLFTGLAILVGMSGFLLLGWMGIGWACVMVGMTLLLMPKLPPEMLMAMYRARRVEPQPGDQLSEIIDILTERAGLAARPTLWVIPSLALNAFASGKPGHAAIAITEGLLRQLTLREIAGVLAHEVSHIRNNDLWVMGVADGLTRITQAMSFSAIFLAALNLVAVLQGEQYASWWAVIFLYLAPLLSNLLQLGLSRAREYDADVEGVQLTGDPLGLASALRRLADHSGRMWEDVMLPAPGRRIAYPSLLRSHPATEERVRRLMALSARPALPPMVFADRPLISLVGFGPVGMRPRVRFPGLWY